MTGVSFDGHDLQTASIITSDIAHESIPAKDAPAYAVAHANRSTLPFINYPIKQITLTGTLDAGSITALDALLDTFRGYFHAIDGNLDIDYDAAARRYVATLESLNIKRPGGLAYAEFTAAFVCTQPFGQAITAIDALPNMVTNSSFETDLSGWQPYVNGGDALSPSLSRDTNEFYHGVASLKHVGNGASAYSGTVLSVGNLVVGQTYTISCYTKGTNGDNFNLFAGVDGFPQINITQAGSWQRVELTFVASATTENIFFRTSTDAAAFYIDAVQLEIGSDATAFALHPEDIDTNSVSFEHIFIGNAPYQLPVTTITLDSVSGGDNYLSVTNNATGQGIIITGITFAAGDVLVIDSKQRTVTLNGDEIDFIGSFPEFESGSQQIDYADGFSGRQFDITIQYHPLYL